MRSNDGCVCLPDKDRRAPGIGFMYNVSPWLDGCGVVRTYSFAD
jgi:hypothetical protein